MSQKVYEIAFRLGASMTSSMKSAFVQANQKVRELSDSTRNLRVNAAKMSAVTNGLAGVTAAAAPATVAVGALGASFAAAGAGALAFGAVANSAITKVVEASEEVAKIEEKIQQADSAKERIAAQKELADLYKNMSKEQQSALQNLIYFKSYWTDYVASFEKPVFQGFLTSLQIAMKGLDMLRPTIDGTAKAVNSLLYQFNAVMQGPTVKGFMDFLATSAPRSISSFGEIFGNTFGGFMNLLRAFDPLSNSVENGLIDMTTRFREWAAGLSKSKSFQNFIEYAKQNGPILLSIIGNVATVIKNVVQKLAPLGSHVLKVVDGVTGFVAKLTSSSPVIGAVVQFIGAKIAQIRQFWEADGAQTMQAIQNIMPVVLGVTKMVWGNIQGVINGALNIIMGAIRIFTGLLTGDFSKMWQGVRQLFLGGIQAAWNLFNLMFIGRIVTGVGGFVRTIGASLKNGWTNMLAGIKSFVGNAGNWFTTMREGIKKKFDEIVTAAKNLPGKIGKGITDKIADATSAMSNLADSLIKRFKTALGIHSPSRIFMQLGGHVISGLVKGLSGGNLKDLGMRVFKDFGGGIFNTFESIKGFLTGGFGGNFKGRGADAARKAITQALAITGTDMSWLQPLMLKAQKESSFNPRAINLWDSNAKKGTPSKGLLQTIDPTFNAYKLPGMNDIYNPVHNAVAAIRYIKSRYGSVFNTPGIKSMMKGGAYKGYYKGGTVPNTQWAWVGERGPELMRIPGGAQIKSNGESKSMLSNLLSFVRPPEVPTGQNNLPPEQPIEIHYNPQVYVQGNADEDTILRALEMDYERFKRFMDRWKRERGRLSFNS